MTHGAQDGRVEVISGVMFSGKSEELLRRLRRALIARKRVQVFKSHLDRRFGLAARLVSHDGSEIDALPIRLSREIRQRVNPETDVVGIDEVQFLDDGIVDVVDWLADRRVRVIVAGTDMDFRGQPFGPMGALMATAEIVDKLHAICVKCGESATRNQRLLDGKPAPPEAPLVHVGGAETYEARCRACHEVPEPGRHQTELDIAGAAEAWAKRTRYW
ncbi:MAG: thymidine kinase [Longimicrobiales bacterium]|nr:thymidine kinase [Longimicrobiales bacterium]